MSICVLRSLLAPRPERSVGMIEKYSIGMLFMKKSCELAHTLLGLLAQTPPPDLPRSLLMSDFLFTLRLLAGFYYHLHHCHICHFAPEVPSAHILVHAINRSGC